MAVSTLYWFRTSRNFGDMLSPVICSRFLGREFSFGGKWTADVSGIGSILGWTLLQGDEGSLLSRQALRLRAGCNRALRRPLVVWGSGLISPLPPSGGVLMRRASVFAVRGELTISELRKASVPLGSDVALGDPGVLLSDVWRIRPTGGVRRGFIPHAYCWEDGTVAAFAREHPEIRLIDPRRAPDEVLSEIADCREVFSSSLHGLVAADAMGLPNRWVGLELPWMTAETAAFKFRDYFSAVGVSRNPCRIADVVSAEPEDPAAPSTLGRRRRELMDAAVAASEEL